MVWFEIILEIINYLSVLLKKNLMSTDSAHQINQSFFFK